MFMKSEQEMNAENTFQDINICDLYLLPLIDTLFLQRVVNSAELRQSLGAMALWRAMCSRTDGHWCFAHGRRDNSPVITLCSIYRNIMGTGADALYGAGCQILEW